MATIDPKKVKEGTIGYVRTDAHATVEVQRFRGSWYIIHSEGMTGAVYIVADSVPVYDTAGGHLRPERKKKKAKKPATPRNVKAKTSTQFAAEALQRKEDQEDR